MAKCGVERTATISLWHFPASMRQHESGEPKLTSVGQRGDRRDSAFVRYPRHAETEGQAVNVALQQSLKWVDGRIVSRRTTVQSARLGFGEAP